MMAKCISNTLKHIILHIDMNTILCEFVKNIENHIYSKELIYRSILVVNNKYECKKIKNLLVSNDHVVYIVDEIHPLIDYDNIDCRILIMDQRIFSIFINHIDNINGLRNSSYNFIGFCYTIPDQCISNMISFYLERTNNNIYDTIIFDKKYFNVMELCSSG